MRNARAQDGFAAALLAAADDAGLRTASGTDEPVAVLELPSSWDEYLARLSRHQRHELRRKRDRIGATTVRTADEATLPRDLDTFFELFRRARGEKRTFMSERMERFFRGIATAFLPLGILRLEVLEVAGRPLVVTFGFQTGSAFYLYNMAYDPAARALSPGAVLISRLVERAIADGLERFDFLRGLERYKLEFGAARSDLRRVRVWAT